MRLIDADALIYELNNSRYPGAPYVDAGISIAIGKALDAPTIEPKRKRGRWLNIDESEKWECSECGRMMWFSSRLSVKPSDYSFYPNCGADMREGECG